MNPPERIYLQADGETLPNVYSSNEVMWCADMINDNDTEYIRGDIAEALNAELLEALEEMMRWNYGPMGDAMRDKGLFDKAEQAIAKATPVKG